MRALRVWRWPALLATFVLSAVGLSPGAVGSAAGSAAPVLDWSRVATQAIVAGRPPASAELLMGIVHIAIADTVAGLGHGRPYLAAVRPDRHASAASAVATATYEF